MRGIILAGGKGTRLKPYTTVLPKPLMPVGDYSIIEIILRQLRHYEFTDITIAVGHLSQLMKALVGDGSRFGLKIDYSYEETPLGTMGPLSLIKDLDETFLVMNGDILTSLDYSSLIGFHKKMKAGLTIATCERTVDIDYGVLKVNERNDIIDYVEKPNLSYNVSMGIYVVEPGILEFVSPDTKLDLPDLVKSLIADKIQVCSFHTDAFWLDIGRSKDYEKAVEEFEKRRDDLLFNS